MRIAVAGGSGAVGRHVVAAARVVGHEPVVLARSHGVDVITGRGLGEALAGVDVVIDTSNVTTTRRCTSVAFFTAATRRLLDAGRRAGVRHHVALSIVGVDRVDLGYYAGKRAQEELVLAGGDGAVPGSVLRATQFHEFPGQVLARLRGPLAVVPRMRTQPVAAAEVADALVALATGPARGMADEFAGPEEHDLVDLARQVVRAQQGRGRRWPVLGVQLPGAAGRALAAGALLPTVPGPRGRVTFAQWLAAGAAARAPGGPAPGEPAATGGPGEQER